jgi:hypothetical protein
LINNAAFFSNSKKIFDFAEQRRVTGFITASAVTDIFYIAQKKLGKKTIKEAIKNLLKVFYPATVTDNNIYQALDLEWDDFEDSVQYIVGDGLSVDYIVTRNTKDFASSSIPAVTPEQMIKTITDKTEQS